MTVDKLTPNYSDILSEKSSDYSGNRSVLRGRIPNVAKRMPLPHPVTEDWRKRVRKELDAGPRGTQARLVEFINEHGVECSSGKLADILNGNYQTSDIVELVHEYFKWPAPLAPSASIDAGELAHLGARMSEEQRDLMARLAAVVAGKTGEEARQMLETMLVGLESRKPPTK